MQDIDETLATLEDVADLLDDLVVCGLRAAEPGVVTRLRATRDEFSRIGAEHLSQALAALVDGTDQDDPSAAAMLIRCQTNVRLFERMLSLESARGSLAAIADTESTEGADATG